jgi:hypothetical protein
MIYFENQENFNMKALSLISGIIADKSLSGDWTIEYSFLKGFTFAWSDDYNFMLIVRDCLQKIEFLALDEKNFEDKFFENFEDCFEYEQNCDTHGVLRGEDDDY